MREVRGLGIREPPLFTTEAQIFVLDTKMQRAWVETSSRPVPVHLYHDLSRRSFRIISVEGSKPVLNGTISSSVIMNKASSKFLQWLDSKTSTVYGLGFSSEKELERFTERVQKIQELSEQTYAGGTDASLQSNIAEPYFEDENISEDCSSDQLIRLENERLKAALAQSSANARKWEEELRGLKQVNQRLTEALNKARTAKTATSNYSDIENVDDKSVSSLMNNLAATLASCLSETPPETSPEEPQEILQQVEQVIKLNRYLRERIECMEKESKDWKDSVTDFHGEMGLKLKELLHLHDKLSTHLNNSST